MKIGAISNGIDAFKAGVKKVTKEPIGKIAKTIREAVPKKLPSYSAIEINGIVQYVPTASIPKGAKVLTKPLGSAKEVVESIMGKGIVNKF